LAQAPSSIDSISLAVHPEKFSSSVGLADLGAICLVAQGSYLIPSRLSLRDSSVQLAVPPDRKDGSGLRPGPFAPPHQPDAEPGLGRRFVSDLMDLSGAEFKQIFGRIFSHLVSHLLLHNRDFKTPGV
jgi:hypothetical protein